MDQSKESVARPIPKEMPKTPEELLAFVSWPQKYEGESDDEFTSRQSLCKTLAKRYADYMAGELNIPKVTVPRILMPKR